MRYPEKGLKQKIEEKAAAMLFRYPRSKETIMVNDNKIKSGREQRCSHVYMAITSKKVQQQPADLDRFEGVSLTVLDKKGSAEKPTAEIRYTFPMDPGFVVKIGFKQRAIGLLIQKK